MSFLAASFLLGTLAIAAPFYVHMIRRSPSNNFVFSTLRFLSPSPETVSSRSRLQHIFLMLLRMLAIILLCMAFARPYIMSQKTTKGSSNIAVLFLVDQSASMNQVSKQKTLKDELKKRIDLLHPEDSAALYTFDKHLSLKKEFNDSIFKPVEYKGSVDNLKAGWHDSDISQAIIEASEKLLRIMDEKKLPKADIELFTDLQDDGEIEKLKQISWPENINLIIHKIPSLYENRSLHFTGISKDKSKANFKVVNHGDTQVNNIKFSIEVAAKEVYQATFNLPAGQEKALEISLSELKYSKNGYLAKISTDDFSVDNQAYFVTPANKPKAISYIGAKPSPGNNLFYLSQLFPQGNPAATINMGLSQSKPDLIIIDGKISTTTNSLMRSYIQKGSTALWLLNDNKQNEQLDVLLNQKLTPSKGKVDDYQMLTSIDFDHWLFKAFSDPLYKDFSSIYFWKYRHAELENESDIRVLAKFENGSPAFLSKTLGKGEIIIMSSSWKKEDSQLAVNGKFVPFMLALINSASRHEANRQNFEMSSVEDLSTQNLTDLKGQKIDSLQPGIYQIKNTKDSKAIAINPSFNESNSNQINEQTLAESGITTIPRSQLATYMKKRHTDEKVLQEITEAEKSNIWQYFLVAVLLLIALESIVGHFTHKRMTLNES